MAPKCVGAATLRDAGNGPFDFDRAGERIGNFNSTFSDWMPIDHVVAGVVTMQAAHLSRRAGITPALAMALAPLVFGSVAND